MQSFDALFAGLPPGFISTLPVFRAPLIQLFIYLGSGCRSRIGTDWVLCFVLVNVHHSVAQESTLSTWLASRLCLGGLAHGSFRGNAAMASRKSGTAATSNRICPA